MPFIAYPSAPRLDSISPEDAKVLGDCWAALVGELIRRDATALFGAANAKPFYQITGVSINRTMNFTTVSTVAALANFVGTLAQDLQKSGRIA